MFTERLKSLRKEAGLTQKEVAAALKIGQNSYSNWENGKREPFFPTIEQLARFFNVSTDYLLGNTNQKNPALSALGNAELLFRKTVDDFKLSEEEQKKFQREIEEFMEKRRKEFEEGSSQE